MTRTTLPDAERRDRRVVAYVTRAEEAAIGRLVELEYYPTHSDALRAAGKMLVEAHEKGRYPDSPLDKTLS